MCVQFQSNNHRGRRYRTEATSLLNTSRASTISEVSGCMIPLLAGGAPGVRKERCMNRPTFLSGYLQRFTASPLNLLHHAPPFTWPTPTSSTLDEFCGPVACVEHNSKRAGEQWYMLVSAVRLRQRLTSFSVESTLCKKIRDTCLD